MPSKHYAKKRFGQHFLTDQRVIAQIVKAIHPKPGEQILEIGPGLGALTEAMLQQCHAMIAIELDRDVIPKLAERCGALGQLQIFAQDALVADYAAFKTDERLLRIIGNLPYNISTPLLFHLINFREVIQDMHFMLQKEVVERMTAEVDTDHYGRLSVMLQYFCNAQWLFEVPPTAFSPPPQVDSAVVRLIPHTKLPYPAKNFQMFSDLAFR